VPHISGRARSHQSSTPGVGSAGSSPCRIDLSTPSGPASQNRVTYETAAGVTGLDLNPSRSRTTHVFEVTENAESEPDVNP